MRYIMEHFGTGLLSGASAVLLISLFMEVLRPGGILNGIVAAFMTGITG